MKSDITCWNGEIGQQRWRRFRLWEANKGEDCWIYCAQTPVEGGGDDVKYKNAGNCENLCYVRGYVQWMMTFQSVTHTKFLIVWKTVSSSGNSMDTILNKLA